MADKSMMVKPIEGGWLLVRLESGEKVSLPEYCHVLQKGTAGGRDSIVPQEGKYKGQAASVTSGYLTDLKHGPKAQVTFYLKGNVLIWPGGPALKIENGVATGGLKAFTSSSNKIPTGTWDIEIPDFPHSLGSGYTSYASHAKTWFRIASSGSNDRFIHPGTVSLGCATIGVEGDKTSDAGKAALKAYEQLYAYLISRRKSPGIVGTLTVADSLGSAVMGAAAGAELGRQDGR
jgi:hypothetical protein